MYYNNCYYKLAYKDENIRRYMTELLDIYSNMQIIDVTLSNKKWAYSTIGNQALANHINDTVAHTTQNEKNNWNSKITCDVSGETLIFTR